MNSDYSDVVKEIKNCRNNNVGYSGALRYMQGNLDSFGGNLNTLSRFSYFDHQNDSTEVPCGFLKKFPISDSGQLHVNSLVRSQFTLEISNHQLLIGYNMSLRFIDMKKDKYFSEIIYINEIIVPMKSSNFAL